jgi:ribonuclease HI
MGGTWKRKTNHDWWKRLDEVAGKHTITWEWVRGHDGHVVQEVADKTARRLAELGYVDNKLLEEAAADIGIHEL